MSTYVYASVEQEAKIPPKEYQILVIWSSMSPNPNLYYTMEWRNFVTFRPLFCSRLPLSEIGGQSDAFQILVGH